MNSRFLKTLLKINTFLVVVGMVIFTLHITFAYSPYNTHPALSEEMAKLFNFEKPEQKLSAQEISWIMKGSIREDEPPRWINHFYDPIHQEGWKGRHFGNLSEDEGYQKGVDVAPKPAIASIDWATNQEYQSAYGKQYGNQTWQKAIKSYIDGDKKSAFIALGHILHLIQDASVPDHTRNDTHADLYGDPGSPYEKYSKEYTNFNELNIAEDLSKEKVLMPLNSLEDAFDHIANYSNKNFFSEDTISNDEFREPDLKELGRRTRLVGKDEVIFIFDKNKNIDIAFVVNKDKTNILLIMRALFWGPTAPTFSPKPFSLVPA